MFTFKTTLSLFSFSKLETRNPKPETYYNLLPLLLQIRALGIFKEITQSLLHLAFPHVCEGCSLVLQNTNQLLCARCYASLPETRFHLFSDNPVERVFWGRLKCTHATAQYYFRKESLMQHLVHEIKYKGNRALGIYLGKLMGEALSQSERFTTADVIVPLPLFAAREQKRGYNQAGLLCEGMQQIFKKPVLENVLQRIAPTESQTRKGRLERWQNMEGKFNIKNPAVIKNKHVLLVDDVITTGATIEACGRKILESGAQLSVAALCFSTH